MSHCPSYTSPLFLPESFPQTVDRVRKCLERIETPFTTIAAKGNSGTPLVGALAYLCALPMLVVRPDNFQAHDCFKVNGDLLNCRGYIIIDDLIDSGTTVNYILSTISKEFASYYGYKKNEGVEPKCVGIVLYNYSYKTSFYGIPVYCCPFRF